MDKKVKSIVIILALVTIAIILVSANVKADEPTQKSIIIKLSPSGINGAVLEGGSGDQIKATYTVTIENKDSQNLRNVSLKFQWIQQFYGWNVSANPSSVVVGNNGTEEVNVIIKAPSNSTVGEETIVKVYAWEYEDDKGEPSTDKKNTTLDEIGGEVTLTTTVVPSERVEINYNIGNESKTGDPGQYARFNLTVKNTGYFENTFSLSGIIVKDKEPLWENALTFLPYDITALLEWNQEYQIGLDVKIPVSAEAGIYTITISADRKSSSDNVDVIVEVPFPDLFIDSDDLYFSHDSILEGQTMTIYVTVGNRGSIVNRKFSVEVSVKTSEGAWINLGIKNITGLEYSEEKTVSYKYKVDKVGDLSILAKVNPDGKVKDQNPDNNVNQKENIQVIEVLDSSNSFTTSFFLTIASVVLISVVSIKIRLKKK